MLKDKNDIYNENYNIDENDVIIKKLNDNKQKKFLIYRRKIFLLGIFLSWILLIYIYISTESNDIRKIVISNSHYLKDEYVIELSGLSLDHNFLFINKNDIIKKINSSPYIIDSKVILSDYNIINIYIEEEVLVAYQFNDKPTILTNDATPIIIEKDFQYLISYFPLLFGNYDKEILKKTCHGLSKIEPFVLENISEIETYETSYDENMVRLLMRDNRYIFSSTTSLEPINYYYDIVKELTEVDKCLYVIEMSNHIYSSKCPWEETEEIEKQEEKQE